MNRMRIWIYALFILSLLSRPALAADTDDDGLDDSVETNTGVYIGPLDTGTDPGNPDTDGDTVMDGPEVNTGSHPLNPTITPSAWKIGLDVRITNYVEYSSVSSLAWTGAEYGVSWEDDRDVFNREIYFARIDGYGNKIGSDVRITNNDGTSGVPSLVWTGTEYGLSWYDDRDGNREIYFARLDASGNKISPDMRITNDVGSSWHPSLVWTGTEYGVSWYDDRDGNNEIYFARIDTSGNKIGSDMRITNAAERSRCHYLIWTGTEYAVSWNDLRDGNEEIYFARIDASGNKIGSDVRITNAAGNSLRPSLVWSDTEYAVSWSDYRAGYYEIYFARIDASGNKIGPDVRITNIGDSILPSLVWTGTEYGVSWSDDRDGNDEIYFARIGVDEDGDGLDHATEATLSTNPNDWDSDDDNFSDGEEDAAGTDPLDPASTPDCNTDTSNGFDVVVSCGNVTVTFLQITSPGITTITTTSTGDPLPAKYRLGNPPVYFHISTTATYVGPVEIYIAYTGIHYGSYSSLKLFHRTTGWHNITTGLDTGNEIICGETNSFSDFVVLEEDGGLIPTLSEWGLILLGIALLLIVIFYPKLQEKKIRIISKECG